MLPFFSFILMWFGTLNWFFISAFQYDFVAGFFGTQSSLFSRIIYFIIGMAGFYMVFYMIKNRGKIHLFQKPPFSKKEPSQQAPSKIEKVLSESLDDDDFEFEKPKTAPIIRPESKAESGYKDFDVTKYDN